jgi:1,4-dihydroxy-6-naphthoate synthase
MSTDTQRISLRIGHSPDPDDAFMWYALANDPDRLGPDGQPLRPRIDTGRFNFIHLLEDIQSLNERSQRGELEITAISIAQYPFVADRYALTSCGSSMGEDYGPKVVSRRAMTFDDLRNVQIAVPGERTTAFLTLSLLLGKGGFRYAVVPFDEILPAVVEGRFDAGLIIHEGQLTYGREGLHQVVDLGQWWGRQTGLPLPLGGNAIRRDLGAQTMREVCTVLLKSIEYALENRQACLDYALGFGRGLDHKLADDFVGMYVNQWTLDYGDRGRAAVRRLLGEAAKAGIVPDCGEVDFVEPG